jgi:predicted nucleotidyltransferase
MNESLKPILAELKQRLTELYGERLSQLILFGSQARGDATEDSDVDVLVVLEGDFDHSKELDRISFITADMMMTCSKLISAVVVSKKDFEARNRRLYQNAAREGIWV